MRTRLLGLTESGLAVLAFVAIGLARCFATGESDRPYDIIYRKNVFRLRPPIVNAKPLPPVAPQATIILTGITTLLGEKRAFLEITPPPRPPQRVKQESCVLMEGEREGQVEVVEINPKAGSVKVSNAGTLMTLTFEKNGRKPAAPVFATPRRTLPRLQTIRSPIRFR